MNILSLINVQIDERMPYSNFGLRGNQSGFLLMPIFRTAPSSNFTIFSNDLITSAMPPIAKTVLLYLLSKPVNWQPKAHDLQKQLGLTAYKVRKGLRWLCSAGFAAYTRLKSGHTIWQIFDKPNLQQPEETAAKPVLMPRINHSDMENQPVLVITETEQILKQPPAAPTPPTITEVEVVVSDELIYPVQLTPVQRKAAKAVIRKVKQPEMKQEVLFALAYAITSGSVKSPVAYLNGLVSRANDGTFEPIAASTASKQGGKPLIPIWQGHKSAPPIDNNSFFAELQRRFGSKAAAAIPTGLAAVNSMP